MAKRSDIFVLYVDRSVHIFGSDHRVYDSDDVEHASVTAA